MRMAMTNVNHSQIPLAKELSFLARSSYFYFALVQTFSAICHSTVLRPLADSNFAALAIKAFIRPGISVRRVTSHFPFRPFTAPWLVRFLIKIFIHISRFLRFIVHRDSPLQRVQLNRRRCSTSSGSFLIKKKVRNRALSSPGIPVPVPVARFYPSFNNIPKYLSNFGLKRRSLPFSIIRLVFFLLVSSFPLFFPVAFRNVASNEGKLFAICDHVSP